MDKFQVLVLRQAWKVGSNFLDKTIHEISRKNKTH